MAITTPEQLIAEVEEKCTCRWRTGHDSRCPATEPYLALLKLDEQFSERLRTVLFRLDDYVDDKIREAQDTEGYYIVSTAGLTTALRVLFGFPEKEIY